MIRCKGEINYSFIVGFLEGDGTILHFNMKNNKGNGFFRPLIRFCNNDKNILYQIQDKLGKGHFHVQHYKSIKYDDTYYLSYDSKKKVSKVLLLLSNNYLSTHRQEQLSHILNNLKMNFIYNKINNDWIKGFMFAEGHKTIRNYIVKNKEYSYTCYGMTQKNKQVLLDIQTQLLLNNINCNIYLNNKSLCYTLCIDKRKDVKILEEVFNIENI